MIEYKVVAYLLNKLQNPISKRLRAPLIVGHRRHLRLFMKMKLIYFKLCILLVSFFCAKSVSTLHPGDNIDRENFPS